MKMRPLNSDSLGKKGEARFAELCADAGLIANPATHDRAGWDYIIDYHSPDGEGDLDDRPAPVTIRVQVKTLWQDRDEIELRLSSAERLVKHDGPSYICVLAVDEGTLEFVGLRLIHCRGLFVERVLRKLRQAQKSGDRPNRVKLRIKPAELAASVTPDHESLRSAFAETVAVDALAYLTEKRTELRTIGYEGPAIKVSTTMAAAPDEIVDAFLGKRDLQVSSFEVSNTRFGIELPVRGAPSGPGKISIRPRPEKCSMRLVGGAEEVVLRGELYRPPAPVISATGIPRMYIKTDVLEFTLSIVSPPPLGRLNGTLTTLEGRCSKRLACGDWARLYRLVSMIGGPGLSLELTSGSVRAAPILMRAAPTDLTRAWGELAQLADSAASILSAAGHPDLRLKLSEIWEARTEIETLSAMRTAPSSVTGIQFTTENTAEVPTDDEVEALHVHTFKLGRFTILQSSRLQLSGDRIGDRVEWRSSPPVLLDIARVKSGADYRALLDRQPALQFRLQTGVRG